MGTVILRFDVIIIASTTGYTRLWNHLVFFYSDNFVRYLIRISNQSKNCYYYTEMSRARKKKRAIEIIASFNADQNRLTTKTLNGSQHIVNTMTMVTIILIICNTWNERRRKKDNHLSRVRVAFICGQMAIVIVKIWNLAI